MDKTGSRDAADCENVVRNSNVNGGMLVNPSEKANEVSWIVTMAKAWFVSTVKATSR